MLKNLVTGLTLILVAMGCSQAPPEIPAAKAEFLESWFWDLPHESMLQATMAGTPAPAVTATGWINGQKSLKDLHGKIVLMDFWGTFCPPCIAAIPEHNALLKTYSPQGFDIMAICASDRGNLMPKVVDKYDIQYSTARDVDEATFQAWNVELLPTYALIDRHGTIRAIGLTPEGIEPALQALLKEQPAA
jgi:peroxiredoxin